MTAGKKRESAGMSIRIIHLAMIVCAVMIAGMLVYTMFQTSTVFSGLSRETGNYIVRQKAAHDLMEASDYLTEMVQRFTLEGDTTYLDKYFEEAFVSKRREAAIVAMSEGDADQTLVQQLQSAMDESMALMYREYYAMKLVIEAREIRDYPDTLKAIELTEEDQFLPAEEKMELAQSMVMGVEYYESKEIIRTRLKSDLELLDEQMTKARQESSNQMNRDLSAARVVTIVLVVLLVGVISMTAHLLTLPLLRAAKESRERKKLTPAGSREFRQLAGQYNEFYDALQQNEAETGEEQSE